MSANLIDLLTAQGLNADAAQRALDALPDRPGRAGPSKPVLPVLGHRSPPRSPDRRLSIERRRSQAASGAMPPVIASRFTTGEQSALSVIAREVQRSGRCDLYIDAIAAMSGICRSVVQSAVREAARLGLVRVTERRIPGRKSLSNLVEVIDQGWRAWLRIGFRKTGATVTDYKNRSESAFRSTGEKGIGAPSALAVCWVPVRKGRRRRNQSGSR